MQLLERDAKPVLAEYGLPVLPHASVQDPDAACAAAGTLGYPVAVKADVLGGRRGIAGLVRKADTPDDVRAFASELLAGRPGGRAVRWVFLEPWCECTAELYLAERIDGSSATCVQLVSTAGGVDIESRADGLAAVGVNPWFGFAAGPLRRALRDQGLVAPVASRVAEIGAALHRAFVGLDARLIELNPIGVRPSGDAVILDAKLFLDENALRRQQRLVARWERTGVADPSDELRVRHRFEYVRLDGDVGLISGGAGMTMAVLDLIAERGGRPACFLDCSQNATAEGYGAALEMLDRDPGVRTVLVNVVGGGTHVDQVARIFTGLLAARPMTKPVVIRLEGTNADDAQTILADAGLAHEPDLECAVDAVVARAGQTS